jgi:STE24 endopeptidase
VPIIGVFELASSAKSRRSNAGVVGVGRTRRILITDTMLREFTAEEVESVLAHELGHQKFLDPIRGFVGSAGTSLVVLGVSAAAYAALHLRFGIAGLGDAAGLPLLAVLGALISLPLGPLGLWLSRRRERRADSFALNLTSNPTAFSAAMVKLHDKNLGVADPSRWDLWLHYTHPSGRERLEFARLFRPSS